MNAARPGRPTLVSIVYTIIGIAPLFLVSSQAVRLQHDLGFGRAGLGAAVSVCFASAAVSAAPLGRLVQRIGPSAGLRMSAGFSLVSLVWITVAATRWWHLAVGLAVCGLANAAAQVSSNIVLAGGVADRRQGVAFGAKQAAIPLASLGAGVMLPVTAALAGWRAAFAAAACLVALAVAVRPHALASTPRPGAGTPVSSRPTVVLGALALAGMLAGAVANALPAFAVDSAVARGIGESAAGVILALGSAAAVLGRVTAGWIADRRRSPGLTELATLIALGVLSLLALTFSGGSDALFVAALLAGFGTAWGWPGLIYYATVRTHPAAPGAATGTVLSCVYVGNVVGPAVVGVLAQHRSYADAWAFATVLLGLATAAALTAGRLQRRLDLSRAAAG